MLDVDHLGSPAHRFPDTPDERRQVRRSPAVHDASNPVVVRFAGRSPGGEHGGGNASPREGLAQTQNVVGDAVPLRPGYVPATIATCVMPLVPSRLSRSPSSAGTLPVPPAKYPAAVLVKGEPERAL